MPRYRRRPIEVEAFQVTEETSWDNKDWPNWLYEAWQKPRRMIGAVSRWRKGSVELRLMTAYTWPVKVHVGDWIVNDGELHHYTDMAFNAIYEPVSLSEHQHRLPRGLPAKDYKEAFKAGRLREKLDRENVLNKPWKEGAK